MLVELLENLFLGNGDLRSLPAKRIRYVGASLVLAFFHSQMFSPFFCFQSHILSLLNISKKIAQFKSIHTFY